MKKNIILILSAVLLAAGCDLTRLPEDSVTPETFFKTESDFRLWSNAFYTQFSSADDLAGLNADDAVDNNPQDCISGSRSAATETWSWGQLRNINYMLEHSSQCTDEAVRTRWNAVGYCFRAYFYSVKVRRYGDIPWYDKVISSTDETLLQQKRDDRAYVMYKVMQDYDKAIAGLPSEHDIANVNKWTALALKSRAALYEGTFRKYHHIPDTTFEGTSVGADWFLQQAADAAKTILEEGSYSLAQGDSVYRKMFIDESGNASEWILARVYGDILGNNVRHNTVNNKQGLTKRFVNHYLLKDGKRITERSGYETQILPDEVKDRDPRLAQTVYCGYSKVYGTKLQYLTCATGYQPIKFESTKEKNASGKGTFDFPVIRLPEVMLNLAEAKAELGTLTQEDLDKTVSLIRARVGLPGLSLEEANADPDALLATYYPNVNSGQNKGVILEIRRERTVELALEGHRQWDMFRWNEGSLMVNHDNPYLGCYFPGPGLYDLDGDSKDDTELYTGDKPTSTLKNVYKIGSDITLSDGSKGNIVAYHNVDYTWQENRDYLWPIPAAQRVLNHNLTQNPNWADGLNF